ncbi:hypothetical protein ElyMa_002561700 [Elysia marginata]|uniref:Uncharacterized protein n=1 Tax=Elysia marginata TaxID=1093978 RepID=A0AAV4GXR1_9GAST|nr:hypothetical protein ElyMa_002561700 [Elysia marginata]
MSPLEGLDPTKGRHFGHFHLKPTSLCHNGQHITATDRGSGVTGSHVRDPGILDYSDHALLSAMPSVLKCCLKSRYPFLDNWPAMLYHRPDLDEVRVCNLPLQRHETSITALRQKQNHLLGRKLKSRINLNVAGNGVISRMQSQQQEQQQQQQQPLPLVELSPFRKSVWRREKSLPDFYERRQGLNSQQKQKDADGKKQGEPHPLFRSLSNGKDKQNQQHTDMTPNEMVARLAAAVNAPDGEFGCHGEDPSTHTSHHLGCNKNKCGTHPKAEFHYESTRLLRSQDLIPGFVTRLERTKTSMLSFYRDNTSCGDVGFYLGEDNGGSFMRSNSGSGNGNGSEHSSNGGNMKVRGGRMKQQVHRRPLLYLNPLDSYRNAHDAVRDNAHPFINYSNVHAHNKVAMRNSFPLTSSQTRDFMFCGAGHTTYPLRPVRHPSVKQQQQQQRQTDSFHPATTCSSPHKFNSKLGAAKNSLEILSSLGTPTKLEKSLVAEYQMNLERFRRDRWVVQPLDLRSVPSQYVSASMNLTRGELCLQEAREANRARRRKNLLTPLGGTSSSASSQLLTTDRGSLVSESGNYTSDAALALQKQQYSFVDPDMHPLDSVLAEESESHVLTDDDLGSASAVNAVLLKSTTKSAPSKMVKVSAGEIRSGEENLMFATTSSCVGKMQHSQTDKDFSKIQVAETDSTKNLSEQEDNETNISFEENKGLVCAQDTTTPVSAGGSSTSRAKTNLEYLNKLRTKGAPRPLHPPVHISEAKDTKSSLSSQENNAVDVGSRRDSDINNGKDSEKNINLNQEKVIVTEKSVSQVAATPSINASVDNHISPQAIVSDSSPSDPQSNVLNTANSDKIQNISQQAPVNGETLIISEEKQTENNYFEVQDSRLQESSSTGVEDAPPEDEGFASPKETIVSKKCESNVLNHDTSIVNKTSRIHSNHSGDKQKEPAQITERSEQKSNLSDSERKDGPVVPPLLSTQAETNEDMITPPLETPFTRVDSATLAGTPLTNLDTSLEPFSENEAGGHSTSADNGDSGVSTTFLTTEDSRTELLAGVVFS